MLLQIDIYFHLYLSSSSILVNFICSSERTVNVFPSFCLSYGSALWIEAKVDQSQQCK